MKGLNQHFVDKLKCFDGSKTFLNVCFMKKKLKIWRGREDGCPELGLFFPGCKVHFLMPLVLVDLQAKSTPSYPWAITKPDHYGLEKCFQFWNLMAENQKPTLQNDFFVGGGRTHHKGGTSLSVPTQYFSHTSRRKCLVLNKNTFV